MGTAFMLTFFLVSCVLCLVEGFVKISPKLEICSKSRPDLNNCIKVALGTLIANLRAGSPELSVPALDPMIISHVESDYEDQDFGMMESFSNVFMFGFCDIKFNTVKVSLQQDKLEISSKIPMLSFQGHYKSDGRVLTYPLASLGTFEVNLTDVTMMWIIYFKRTAVNGTKYLQVEQLFSEMVPLDVNINVVERFNEDNKLQQDRLNSVLNESSAELFIHFKPKLTSLINQIFVSLINNVLSQFPENEVLPD
uniref:Uncharacterized protein n=2 Tax=Clastoptera arizonana TaxID=38151 RepID=A0A1B6CMR9_9HEMI